MLEDLDLFTVHSLVSRLPFVLEDGSKFGSLAWEMFVKKCVDLFFLLGSFGLLILLGLLGFGFAFGSLFIQSAVIQSAVILSSVILRSGWDCEQANKNNRF